MNSGLFWLMGSPCKNLQSHSAWRGSDVRTTVRPRGV